MRHKVTNRPGHAHGVAPHRLREGVMFVQFLLSADIGMRRGCAEKEVDSMEGAGNFNSLIRVRRFHGKRLDASERRAGTRALSRPWGS